MEKNYKIFESDIYAIEFSILNNKKESGLVCLYVKYKNQFIKITKGFTQKERLKYYKNKNYFFDKQIYIKYLNYFINELNQIELQGISIDKIIKKKKKNNFFDKFKFWKKKKNENNK